MQGSPPALERWARIPGTRYEVSELGRVRNPWGTIRKTRMNHGHLSVQLEGGMGGRRIYRQVARLVLEAFVGPAPESKPLAGFGDRDKRNVVLTNLYWAPYHVARRRPTNPFAST